VNSRTLGPGDQVLFERGTSCTGQLAPQGSGTFWQPIVIGAYGWGSLPVLNATLATSQTVLLANMSHVQVRDLSLTGDPVGAPTNSQREGIQVVASTGVVSDVTIEGLTVSDVGAPGQQGGAQGIGFFASAGQHFNGAIIRNNTVSNIGGGGITVFGGGSNRPSADVAWPSASTNVLITHNRVSYVQNNGIFVSGDEAPATSFNTVSYATLDNGGYTTAAACAVAVWGFNVDNALFEYNSVSHSTFDGTVSKTTGYGCDGDAYDIDYDQDGTVFQYNYSYDNPGGFILFCATNVAHRGIVRYNLSVDDGDVFGAAPCQGEVPPTTYDLDGIQVYNNTFVSTVPKIATEQDQTLAREVVPYYGNFLFENNIVYATGTVPSTTFFNCGSNCSNNLYYGMPSATNGNVYGANAVFADPLMFHPLATSDTSFIAPDFQVAWNSPAICAGTTPPAVMVPALVVTRDYFGHPIPQPETIGFDQRNCSKFGQLRRPGL